MPESEAHESKRSRPKPQQDSRQRTSSTDRGQATSEPAADMQELQHPWESLLDSDFSQRTFERHAALLGDSRMSHRMYRQQRAAIVMQLQRDYGNRYVQRLVKHISQKRAEAGQAKLTVGPAGDKYEEEADQVAKQVMGTLSTSGSEAAQRQEEEEELQMKPLVQRQEEEELQMKPLVRRQEEEEEELQAKPLIQRQVGLDGGDVKPQVEQAIHQKQGGGQALPDNLRTSMEGAFGADFSGVRVHNDTEADALNNSMQARAFTTGQDIYLRQGEYNPGNSTGQELLAHELTHVVQQADGAIQRESVPRSPNKQGTYAANRPEITPAEPAIQREHKSYYEIEQVNPSGPQATWLITKKFEGWKQSFIRKSTRRDKAQDLYLDTNASYYGFFKQEYQRLFDEPFKQLGAAIPESDEASGTITLLEITAKKIDGLTAKAEQTQADIKKMERQYEENLRAYYEEHKDEISSVEQELNTLQSTIENQKEALTELYQRLTASPGDPKTAADASRLVEELRIKMGRHDQLYKRLRELRTPPALLPEQYVAETEKVFGTREKLQAVQKVHKEELAFEGHNATFDILLEKYSYLRSPGSSASLAGTVTLNWGAEAAVPLTEIGLGVGAFVSVGVKGQVATGDDTKVRPSLTFELKAGAKFNVGTWEATASIGVSYTMAETYSGLEDFVANYTSILARFAESSQRYTQTELRNIRKDYDDAIDDLRQALIEEYGGDEVVSSARDVYDQIEMLRQKNPGRAQKLTGAIDAGLNVGKSLGISGAASLTRTKFTKTAGETTYERVGTNEERSLSGSFKLGPFDIGLTGKYNKIQGDANPDNNGEYLNLKLAVGGTILSHAMQSPGAASPAQKQALTIIDRTLDDFSSEINAAIDETDVVGSVKSWLQSSSIVDIPVAELTVAVTTALGFEVNMVKVGDTYRVQYARATIDRALQAAVKGIPLGSGFSMDIAVEGKKTTVLGELIGTNTLTYVETMYHGLMGQPEGDAKWSEWVNKNKKSMRSLFLNIGNPESSVAAEAGGDLRVLANKLIYEEKEGYRYILHPILWKRAKGKVAEDGTFNQLLNELVSKKLKPEAERRQRPEYGGEDQKEWQVSRAVA